jgi:Zn-dependent protease with chaperone function
VKYHLYNLLYIIISILLIKVSPYNDYLEIIFLTLISYYTDYAKTYLDFLKVKSTMIEITGYEKFKDYSIMSHHFQNNIAFSFRLDNLKIITLNEAIYKTYQKSEIESIIGHEIGHQHGGHSHKSLIMTTLLRIIVIYLSLINPYFILSIFPLSMLQHLIERNNEYYADKYSLNFVTPEEMINTLETLGRYTKDTTSIFSTHPSLSKRINRIKRYM